MGSGLILLIIVGAWLAVLVPMALRSHDTVTAASTVDRFSDAMRVLSRRSAGLELPVDDVPLVPPPAARRRRGPSAAARRRRVLSVLVLLCLAGLAAAVVGPAWLWAVSGVADLLLLAFLGWLRSTAAVRAGRAGRERRTALGDRGLRRRDEPAWSPSPDWAPEPVPAPRTAAVSPAPAAAPAREAVLFDQELLDGVPQAEVQQGERHAVAAGEPVPPPARGAQGAPWQPVPLPVPTYVTAARAPRRIIDLTAPAPGSTAAGEALASAERSLGIDDRGRELEHILGRHAVSG